MPVFNLEDARYFRGFTGTINHSWLTNQSARIDFFCISSTLLWLLHTVWKWASGRRVGQRPDCHTFLCKFWHFQMAVSQWKLAWLTPNLARWSGDLMKRLGNKNFNAVSHNRSRPEVLFLNLAWRSRGQISSVLLQLLLFAFSNRKFADPTIYRLVRRPSRFETKQ